MIARTRRKWLAPALACLVWGSRLEAQLDADGPTERNGFTVELGAIGIGVAFVRQVDDVQIGIAGGAGARLGWMLLRDEFTTGGYGADRTSIELAYGDLVLRSSSGRAWQVEGGLRAAWVYHPPTEYETLFIGAQLTPLLRVGRFRVGPRLVIGRMTEEAGRSAFNLGVQPLTIRYEWMW